MIWKMFFLIKKLLEKMKRIGSKIHNMYSQEIDKISLSWFDDKRYILSDRINTLAYNHKDIPQNEQKSIFFLLK